jgi:hypothetical protein
MYVVIDLNIINAEEIIKHNRNEIKSATLLIYKK